jgi:hypothetical protein
VQTKMPMILLNIGRTRFKSTFGPLASSPFVWPPVCYHLDATCILSCIAMSARQLASEQSFVDRPIPALHGIVDEQIPRRPSHCNPGVGTPLDLTTLPPPPSERICQP